MKTRNTISIILSVSLAFCFGAPISAFADEIASPVPQQQEAVEASSVAQQSTQPATAESTQEAIDASSSSNAATKENASSSAASSSYSHNESALLSDESTQESTESSSKAKTTEEITVDKIADPEEGVSYAEGEVIITYKDSKEAAVKAADDANAIEVVPANDATVEAKASASKADEVKVVSEKAPVADVIATSDGETTVVAQTPNNMSVAQTIEALSVDPDIESVEPNHIMSFFGEDDEEQADEEQTDEAAMTAQALTNDPYATNNQWYLSSINCGAAWNYAKCNNKVAVAVLDTGCNVGHSDLSQNITATYDTTTKGAVKGDGGSTGHGTHVAGIVSARSNNGIGTSGVSYNANLVCIDVFRGNGDYAYDSDIIAAYKWLIDEGNASRYNVRVINMSLGSTGDTISPTSSLAKYIDKANAAGIVTVCAAGNSGQVEPSYIADYSTCVGVMNLRNTGSGVALASSSTRSDAMDIAAPGTSIYSTASNGSYKSMSGTSMAAPVVSGVLAMEFAANPNLSANEAKNILYQTATSVNIGYGYGEVNAQEAAHVASGNTSLNTAPASPSVSYTTHVQNVGWQGWVTDGAMSGTSGRSLRLEGIKINETGIDNLGIRYMTHVQSIGWQGWSNDGAMSGTSGRSLRLEGIKIELTGSQASNYDVFYRVHAQNVGWMGWAKNGSPSGTAGYSKRLEGIQIVILPKGSTPDTTYKGITSVDTHPFIDSGATNGVASYNATMHIQNKGNTNFSTTGSKSLGTTGSSLRVEALTITNFNAPAGTNLGVKYRTHIQNIGWQDWKTTGQMSGTSGRALRLEALQIELTGSDASSYDVYYRTHVQNIGWTGWAKNGQQCGSAGYGYRMEAMQIVVVPKWESAPGINSGYFYQK